MTDVTRKLIDHGKAPKPAPKITHKQLANGPATIVQYASGTVGDGLPDAAPPKVKQSEILTRLAEKVKS